MNIVMAKVRDVNYGRYNCYDSNVRDAYVVTQTCSFMKSNAHTPTPTHTHKHKHTHTMLSY